MIVQTLLEVLGSPARVESAKASERQPGMLVEVTEQGLRIDLLNLPEALAAGTPVDVELHHSSGLFRFSGNCLPNVDNPRGLLVSIPDRVEVIQRRRHARLDISLNMQVQRVGSPPVAGRTLNISASGMAFTAPVAANSGEQVQIWLRLTNGVVLMPLVAQILRVAPGPDGNILFAAAFLDNISVRHSALEEFLQEMLGAKGDSRASVVR